MPMQDYLTFFQNLLSTYYTFTLENDVYAACLATSVWLITAALYSISIGSLKNKIAKQIKLYQESQSSLANANEHIHALQINIESLDQQLTEQSQQSQHFSQQLSEISQHLATSISNLAAQPDLGQSGLTLREDLSAWQLWQRYHAAVSQICQRLQTNIKTYTELELSHKTTMAKLAEKDLQLQGAQLRADSLKQQVVKLETAIQELQNQFAVKQTELQQRLTELNAKHQSDLARLAVLEANHQADLAHLSALQQAQSVKPQVTTTVVEPQVEALKAIVEPAPLSTSSALSQAEIPQIVITDNNGSNQTISTQLAHDQADVQRPNEPAINPSNSGFGNKFKSMLSTTKSKIDKLDQKLGQRTPLPPETDHEPELLTELAAQTKPEQVIAAVVATQPTAPAKKAEQKILGQFKNLLGSKAKPTISASEAVVTESQLSPEQEAVPNKKADAGLTKQFKNLLGSKTKQATTATEALVTENNPSPEPEAASGKKADAGLAKQFKNILGSKAKPATTVSEPLVTESHPEPEAAPSKKSDSGLSKQFKNILSTAKPVSKPEPVFEATSAEPEQETVTEQNVNIYEDPMLGKMKNLLGFGAKKSSKVETDFTPIAEQPITETKPDTSNPASQVKNLLGKFGLKK